MTTIRCSTLPSYPDCARRESTKIIRDEIEAIGFTFPVTPSNAAAHIGSAVHAAGAYTMQSKIDRDNLGSDLEAIGLAINSYDEAAKEATTFDDTTPNHNTAVLQVRHMVGAYRLHLAPKLKPIKVETRLRVDLDDGFILSGQSDLVTIEPGNVRDTKTGAMQRTHYGQLGGYSLNERTHGQIVDRVTVDFIQRVSLKKPQPVPVSTEYDPRLAEEVAMSTIRRIKADVTEFRRRVVTGDGAPENAFLANPNSALCSAKYCQAWGTAYCREHRK